MELARTKQVVETLRGLGRVLGCVGDETYEDEGRHNGAGECRRNLRVRQGWGRWEGRRTGGRRAGCKQAKAASGAEDDVLQKRSNVGVGYTGVDKVKR